MLKYRVICIGNRRASKVMHTKQEIKEYIRTCKAIDKQMIRGNTYIVMLQIKI